MLAGILGGLFETITVEFGLEFAEMECVDIVGVQDVEDEDNCV